MPQALSSRCCTAAWGASGLSAALTQRRLGAINTAIDSIDAAIATLRSKAKTLASNLSIVTTRQDFTDKMIATLKIGGDNLTLADMNEEGANMLMLQTTAGIGYPVTVHGFPVSTAGSPALSVEVNQTREGPQAPPFHISASFNGIIRNNSVKLAYNVHHFRQTYLNGR